MKGEGLKRGLVNADYDSDNEEIYDVKPKVESKFQSTETLQHDVYYYTIASYTRFQWQLSKLNK